MEFVLSKCKLRPFRTSDARSLAYYANNPNISANLRDIFPHPYTSNDAECFIASIVSSPKSLIMAIDVKGEAVGSIGIHKQNDVYRQSAELGYWLGEPFWGQGMMSEAVSSIVSHSFSNSDLIRIYSNVFERNLASIRVLEKCGFEREALLRHAVLKRNFIFKN